MVAPSILPEIVSDAKRDGAALEAVSDDVDLINKVKGIKDTERRKSIDKNVGTKKDGRNAHARAEVDKDDMFRNYLDACERVKSFYREQHTKQTVAFNLAARVKYNSTVRAKMGIWQALEKLNTLIDESDPDTELSQIEHLLQTAEAIRRDGKPRWFQITGLIHDLGKLLYFFDAPGQWAVVGDTFPIGCAFSDSIIYPETFADNPDDGHPIYSTELGIYTEHCGLDSVMLSFGHDEYLYQVLKRQSSLPEEALAMIRYHSFYPWHREGGYKYLMNEKDHEMLNAVKEFNPYDLYSKADLPPNVDELKSYYLDLIKEFFPKEIEW